MGKLESKSGQCDGKEQVENVCDVEVERNHLVFPFVVDETINQRMFQ